MQILDLDGINSQERQYLHALAAIIEDEPADFTAIIKQVNCPSAISLWAFLATPDDLPSAAYDRAAILQAFKNLPISLQIYLGPRLAHRFTIAGDYDAAQQALSAARLAAPDAVDTRLADAALAGQDNDATARLQTLTDLTQSPARLTPQAMTLYLDEANRLGEKVPQETMLLADALRFEAALTPMSGDLAAAQIRAHILADDFENAHLLLTEEKDALGPDRFATVMLDYGLAATDRMRDGDFLTFAYGTATTDAPPQLQQRVAARLISLGFPDRALEMLHPDTSELADDSRRHLRALAYLELGDPDTALTLLNNDSSDYAQQLLQVALAMRAGNTAALPTMAAPDAVETMWRNGDWARLAQTDDPLINTAAAAILNTGDAPFDDERPIASGRLLLDQAAQSRALLDSLLQRFAQPEDIPPSTLTNSQDF